MRYWFNIAVLFSLIGCDANLDVKTVGTGLPEEHTGTVLPEERTDTGKTSAPTFVSLIPTNEASDGFVNASEAGSALPLFLLSASDYVALEYTEVLADSALSCDDSLNYSSAEVPAISSIPAMDGAYAVCVKLVDNSGNVTYGKSQQVIRDTAPPIVSVGSDVAINANYLIHATVSGATTYAWTKVSGVGDLTFGTPTAPNTTVIANADGAYVLRLTAADAAGNSAYDELNLDWDVTPPTVNVGADLTVRSPTTVDASTGGAPSTYAWTVTSGPGVITFGSPAAEDTTVAADVDGVYVLRLTVADALGNTTYDELNFDWDTTPPSFSSLSLTGDAPDGYINSAEKTNTTAIWSLSATSYAAVSYSSVLDETPTPATCDETQEYNGTSIPSANNLPAIDDTYAICVKLADAAGNITYGKSQTLIRDVTLPTVSAPGPLHKNAAFFYDATTSGATSWSWSMFSGGCGLTFDSPNSEDTTMTGSIEGLCIPQLTATDAAGNSATGSFLLTWDTIAPSIDSFTLANGASDGYINNAEKNATTALTSVSATGASSYLYTAPLPSPATCDATQTYGSSTAPRPVDIVSDGVYLVCIKVSDNAGNVTYAASPTITRDIVPPTLNAGADQVINQTYTLTGSATGAVSTTWSQISGPGTATFGDTSSPTSTVDMPAKGAYILQLRATDAAGNSATDTLELVYVVIPESILVLSNQAGHQVLWGTSIENLPIPTIWSLFVKAERSRSILSTVLPTRQARPAAATPFCRPALV